MRYNRRMTRLTNAFSKKAENHAHMMAIYFMHYNFVRIHQSLRVTPAMAAGVTPKLWEMSDLVKVLEDWKRHRPHRDQTVPLPNMGMENRSFLPFRGGLE